MLFLGWGVYFLRMVPKHLVTDQQRVHIVVRTRLNECTNIVVCGRRVVADGGKRGWRVVSVFPKLGQTIVAKHIITHGHGVMTLQASLTHERNTLLERHVYVTRFRTEWEDGDVRAGRHFRRVVLRDRGDTNTLAVE